MSGIFRRFWEWLRGLFLSKKMDVAIIGLSNAGKTTLVHALMGEPKETVPTVGVVSHSFKKGNVNIHAWDMGGHKQYQFMWKSYCQNSNAILFVLDASDENAIEESSRKLDEMLSDADLERIPILVCGNKCDIDGSMSAEDLISRMRLNEVEGNDRDISLFVISAKEMTNLDSVFKWLVKHA